MEKVACSVCVGASQSEGDPSYTSCCNQASVSSNLLQTIRFHSLLTPLHSLLSFGRSGLRPSLVQGLRPRNAPPLLATVLILPQQRVWPTVFPPDTTAGAGPVPTPCLHWPALVPLNPPTPGKARPDLAPAPRLSKSRETTPAAAGIISPPDCYRPKKSGVHTSAVLVFGCSQAA